MFGEKVRGEAEGVLDVRGGWVVEGREVEGLEREMRAWMGTVGWEKGKGFVERGAFGGWVGDCWIRRRGW